MQAHAKAWPAKANQYHRLGNARARLLRFACTVSKPVRLQGWLRQRRARGAAHLQGAPVAPVAGVDGHQPIEGLLLAAKALEAELCTGTTPSEQKAWQVRRAHGA